MATNTQYYNLTKPGSEDNALISDINGNMDAIDRALHDKQDALSQGTGISIDNGTISVDADSTPTDGSSKPVTSNGVYDALSLKQDALTKGTGIEISSNVISVDADTVPTDGSSKPITSDAVYDALANKQDTLTKGTGIEIASNVISVDADAVPTDGSSKPVTSNGVYDALADKVDKNPSIGNLMGAVTTMPTASAALAGYVVYFTGTSTADYTQGMFYKCVETSTPGTFVWREEAYGNTGYWEELDPANLPTDFKDGDILMFKPIAGESNGAISTTTSTGIVIADMFGTGTNWCGMPYKYGISNPIKVYTLDGIYAATNWNNGQSTDTLIKIVIANFTTNGGSTRLVAQDITRADFATYVARIWRLIPAGTTIDGHRLIVSEEDPSGGFDGDIWFKHE